MTATTTSGAIWTRTDGSTTVDQTHQRTRVSGASDNEQYTLTNVTPNFSGYKCTVLNSGSSVTLQATNWYLRCLALYIQFLNGYKVVPASSLPAGVVPEESLITANDEILLHQINPEFTLYGIPVQTSGASYTFSFPSGVATSARVIASGLGEGSHGAQDTELLGTIMTSVFNFILPPSLLVLGLGTTIDVFVKVIGISFALTMARIFEALSLDSRLQQGSACFIVRFLTGALYQPSASLRRDVFNNLPNHNP